VARYCAGPTSSSDHEELADTSRRGFERDGGGGWCGPGRDTFGGGAVVGWGGGSSFAKPTADRGGAKLASLATREGGMAFSIWVVPINGADATE
jgi:hypothetical protein